MSRTLQAGWNRTSAGTDGDPSSVGRHTTKALLPCCRSVEIGVNMTTGRRQAHGAAGAMVVVRFLDGGGGAVVALSMAVSSLCPVLLVVGELDVSEAV